MNNALLVATREFGENAKTKGFWIGLFLFPLILLVAVKVPRFLEDKAVPTRDFALVDLSGSFGSVIANGLRRYEVRKKQEAFFRYTQNHADSSKIPGGGEIDFEKLPADMFDPAKALERLEDQNPEVLDLLGTEAGWAATVEQAAQFLKEDRPAFEAPRPRFRRAELPAGLIAESDDADAIAEKLRPYLLGKSLENDAGGKVELFAAIVVPADIEKRVADGMLEELLAANEPRGGIQYWSANLADNDLRDLVQKSVNEDLRQRRFVSVGMDPAEVRRIQNATVPMASLNPKKAAGEEAVSAADVLRQWAPVGFVYLLWVAIFTVAQMLLSNTIEEKSNRIIEVLLSSVTPGELMMGKLLGIAMVGLTMIGAWILSFILVLKSQAGPEAEWAGRLFEVVQSSGLLPLFALYFILGYLTYSGLFLAIGSLCNTLKEAQNFMGPVMVIMMVPLFTMMFIPRDPNGTLATILSWIPLYTPFVMMNRAAADPPAFEFYGTLVLMICTTVVMLWLSGKIFRTGILRTGQPPKLLELLRWLRSS
ncbi:MAG TPA: ABC transporter permease [Planctomycetota bacterium]